MASAPADRSPYVRFEVETGIKHGLRVVPVAPAGGLPAGLQALLAQVRGSEALIPAPDSDRAAAFASALARLQRGPDERLQWLRFRREYQALRGHITRARADQGTPRAG